MPVVNEIISRYRLLIPITFLTNLISGLRNYTNYIEVRISVEYAGLATYTYAFCAHVFRAVRIYFVNPIFIRESEFAAELPRRGSFFLAKATDELARISYRE
ncbi:hypothetical protein P5V15_000151 [Pogonomyrmex californicus]